jgi:hypothetical protein
VHFFKYLPYVVLFLFSSASHIANALLKVFLCIANVLIIFLKQYVMQIFNRMHGQDGGRLYRPKNTLNAFGLFVMFCPVPAAGLVRPLVEIGNDFGDENGTLRVAKKNRARSCTCYS